MPPPTARKVFSDWASLVLRLRPNDPVVEVEWTVGPIPDAPLPGSRDGAKSKARDTQASWKGLRRAGQWGDEDDAGREHEETTEEDRPDVWGREVVLRVRSSVESGDGFLTDANGRDILSRRRNFRPTWDLNVTNEPIASNYYPVTSFVGVSDRDLLLGLVTDRAQAAASLDSGEIEASELMGANRSPLLPAPECPTGASTAEGLHSCTLMWVVVPEPRSRPRQRLSGRPPSDIHPAMP